MFKYDENALLDSFEVTGSSLDDLKEVTTVLTKNTQFMKWHSADIELLSFMDKRVIERDKTDEKGNPVHLPVIHFIMVYNAINQSCGWIGETSTEICGGEDLHPDAELSGVDTIIDDENAAVEYYNLQGVKVNNPHKGVFIKRQAGKTAKMILR